MAFDPTDLGQTFQEAIKRFNAADYDSLAGLFHDNVEMKQVDDVDVERSKQGVRDYLNNTQKNNKPQFNIEINNVTQQPDYLLADAGSTGITSGYGNYADIKGKTAKRVLYCFVFLRDANRNWLLRLGFATLLEK